MLGHKKFVLEHEISCSSTTFSSRAEKTHFRLLWYTISFGTKLFDYAGTLVGGVDNWLTFGPWLYPPANFGVRDLAPACAVTGPLQGVS